MGALKDFPSGPLDHYRHKASFDWKKLKINLDGEDIVKYQDALCKELYKRMPKEARQVPNSVEEERSRTDRQFHAYGSIPLLSLEHWLQDLRRPVAASTIMMQLAPACTLRYIVVPNLVQSVVLGSGTDRHRGFVSGIKEGKIFACFCLTEIGHGTNAKGMRTTATYNKGSKTFVLNSPDFEAAKCWVGSLAQTATHAVVFAQLVLNGEDFGLHSFIVPIREPKTMRPFPGIVTGDMGEKIGLNGIDNGFMLFHDYPIPRENLLNGVADVTEDGRYVTPYTDPNKRYGASLGGLSGTRAIITSISTAYGTRALTIAIRYAAVRRQFGPSGQPELPILEYQTHQYRLLPHLAALYVLREFSKFISENQHQFFLDQVNQTEVCGLPEKGGELHALSSGSKPLAGWTMRDAIQECREACGGHGYLKIAGIGDIRNDHDASLTYEGENHVLIQQTSKWLLKFWPVILQGGTVSTPFRTADFLSQGLHILRDSKFTAKNIAETCEVNNIINAFQWLTCYLLRRLYEKTTRLNFHGIEPFRIRNECQVFYAKNLGIVFTQHVALQCMLDTIEKATDWQVKAVLTRLFALYGLWSLEKHIGILYQGGYASGEQAFTLIQNAILELCETIKDDAVSLIDAIAAPDFVVNSVLGASDGLVYQRLQSELLANSDTITKSPNRRQEECFRSKY